MPRLIPFTASILLLASCVAQAKDKKKNLLPADVLSAHTVFVMVDPHAGLDIQDPNANNKARRDVESALVKWGRLDPIEDAHQADLIIVIRRGHGKEVQPTIGGTPVNNQPSIGVQPSQTGITGAGREGRSGFPDDASVGQSQASRPYPQTEIGAAQDMFVVYRGAESNPLDSPPVWRYWRDDALAAPDVPAVEAFRKLIADSEKQLAPHP